jgi:hypothetical protein
MSSASDFEDLSKFKATLSAGFYPIEGELG